MIKPASNRIAIGASSVNGPSMQDKHPQKYHRYHIKTEKAPDIIPHPHRFNVRVNKLGLAKLLFKELMHYRGKLDVILSRPCIYGVFSGPIGGFAPRERLCVGCMRCTTQYPEMVQVLHNPQRKTLGDVFFTPDYVDTVIHEAESGRIPIKGQGYRGKFGGTGWDGMWTDMSEIVRPTRDGIHGREFISTAVDIGSKPPFLELNNAQQPIHTLPTVVNPPIPFLFDLPPLSLETNRKLGHILSETAQRIQSYTVLPLASLSQGAIKGSHIIPLVGPQDFEALKALDSIPALIEMAGWDERLFHMIRQEFPQTLPILRTDFEGADLLAHYKAGVRIFHLTANYHGRSKSGRFVIDLIRDAHLTFVREGCREEVTLIGSGGIVAAEHVPKAIICGLDAVALDTPLLVALQARFAGPCIDRQKALLSCRISLKRLGHAAPDEFSQRLARPAPGNSGSHGTARGAQAPRRDGPRHVSKRFGTRSICRN